MDVTFDATGLPPGEQTGNLCIASNDPVNPPTEEISFSGSVMVDGADGEMATAALSGSGIELGADIFSDRFEE